jgi:hypothetical protein
MKRSNHIHIIVLCGLLAAGPAAAQSYAAIPKDTATTEPLHEAPANVRSQPLSDGEVSHEVQLTVPVGEAPVTVRSIEPNSLTGHPRIDFEALDTDGDGFISREEAQADPALAEEFNLLDTTHRGKLSREQLADWVK